MMHRQRSFFKAVTVARPGPAHNGEPMRSTVSLAAPRTARPAAASVLTIVLAFLGFISLGLPDGLLGVAWPSMRETFGTSLDALGALLITVTTGYLLSSISSGRVVARTGIGLLLALSSFLTAAALLGYALAPVWSLVVLLGLLAGAGAGAVDAGVNAYAAVHYSRRFLSLLHASFGLGAALGPVIMMSVLSNGHVWRWGYAAVGLLQIALGICFLLTARQWGTMSEVTPGPPRSSRQRAPPAPAAKPGCRGGSCTPEMTPLRRVPRGSRRSREFSTLPIVWLSIALFFVYTGIEATGGQWSYTLFTEGRGVAPGLAGLSISAYWGGLMAGRVLFGLVANQIQVTRLLRIGMVGVLCGVTVIWLDLAEGLSLVGLALVGFFAAPIFPSLIASTPERIGPERAASVVGFQVGAASLGIGLLPALAGVLAERFGLESIPAFLVLAAVGMVLLHEWLARRGRPFAGVQKTRE